MLSHDQKSNKDQYSRITPLVNCAAVACFGYSVCEYSQGAKSDENNTTDPGCLKTIHALTMKMKVIAMRIQMMDSMQVLM